MDCKYCSKGFKTSNSLRNHEVRCKANPNKIKNNYSPGLSKAIEKTETCKYCKRSLSKANIKKHEESCKKNPINIKYCPVCEKSFTGKSVTCSRSCSNTHFRHKRVGGARYRTDKELIDAKCYRDLCFRHHEKKCIICGERLIVSVHHLNGNHSDNSIGNLVPLCPTHHQYLHSKHKHEIIDAVILYAKME